VTAWLGVVSAEHVARGVALGIAQVNHGNRGPLARMGAGDGFVYYSPRRSLRDGEPVRAFTAVGVLADDELWQGDEGDWRPWRRRVHYAPSGTPVPIADLRGRLELTTEPNWGYRLRRGLIPLSDSDFVLIHHAMTGSV
jgi:hypothetical protein